eukprot:CAMPEP_0168619938 /NCGR_PEP_ID=MMETSP0449_2-20121227/6866_1 /TAXON_ID=1082188 /ORGANISM="Strombidium rassoulzadegani, Strain ras09" /LENGTH=442 /DNA_ID=CAMNT_0008660901 /DNA_START=174 /DNA_END=1502 /DNA_ORIENTATION=+
MRVASLQSINYLFKDYYKLDPSIAQSWQVLMSVPWSLKIFYGLVSDNLVLFGSRKRCFFVIGGLVQFFSLQLLFWGSFDSVFWIAILATFGINMTSAFMDLVLDSVIISEQRKDLTNGSENLRTFQMFFQFTGAIIGFQVAGVLNQYMHPKWAFLINSSFGAFVAFVGTLLNRQIDTEGIVEMKGFWSELRRTLREVFRLREMPIVYRVILFLLLDGLMGPSFGEFQFYYLTDVRKISKLQIANIEMITSFASLGGIALYSVYFRTWEFRNLLYLNYAVCLLGCLLNLCFIYNVNKSYHIDDYYFMVAMSVLLTPFSQALNLLPLMVLMTKIAPKGIECTAFAILIGCKNMSLSIIAPMMGSFINDSFVGVTKQQLRLMGLTSMDFDHMKYDKLYIITIALSTISTLLIPNFIPYRADIDKFQLSMIEDSHHGDHDQARVGG